MKRLLSILLTITLLAGLAAFPVEAMADTDTWYATVEGGWLRLRERASFNADTVNSYNVGTIVQVLDANGDWYKVKTPDGSVGYMYSKYLARGGVYAPDAVSSYTGVTNATIVSANGYGVRMRSGPSTSYRIVRKYPVGTRCEIIQQGSYWSRIRVDGRTGYMMNRFLSKDGGITPPTPYYDGDATVWSSNGYGVRLRSGPGTGYRRIGVYSVGTQVTVLSKGDVWDYIQIGSRVGYMMNKFLIYNNNYNVSGVTLNNYNPVVGNILSVQTVRPSSATVTFQWYADKEARGTNASYTVTDADIGKQIRLVVTGIGCYSGYAVSDPTAIVLGSGVLTAVTLNITQPYAGNILRAETITPTGATVTYQWKDYATNNVLGTGQTYEVKADDATQARRIYLTVTGRNTYTGAATSAPTEIVQASAHPTITSPATLASATIGLAYKETLKAVGGGATFTWSILSGKLPNGLILNNATGVISGTIAAGETTQTVTIKVSNGIAPDDQRTFTIPVQTQVAVPVITPEGGAYDGPQLITMSHSSASIYYTVGGADPTPTTGTLYTAPFTLSSSNTVKAIAATSGMTPSAVVSKTYTITKSAPPVLNPAGGEGTKYTRTTGVTLTVPTGATVYYTTNGTTPSPTNGTVYTAGSTISIPQGAPTTLMAVAITGNVSSNVMIGRYINSTDAEYAISYMNESELTFNYGDPPRKYTVGEGATLPTSVTSKTAGNAFVGWYTNSNCTGTAVTAIAPEATGEQQLWAKFEASTDSHAISYKYASDSSAVTFTTSVPVTYYKGKGKTTLPAGTLLANLPADKKFEGWYDNAACTGAPLTEYGNGGTADVTFYAKTSTATQWRVLYKLNGSYVDMSPNLYYQGKGVQTLPTRTETGWTGWYRDYSVSGGLSTPVDTTKWAITTEEARDVTFYGGSQQTVTLNANGGTNGNVTSINVVFGKDALTAIAAGDLPTHAAPLSNFAGFYDAATGGNKYYNSDGTVAYAGKWSQGSITLFAQWSATPVAATSLEGASLAAPFSLTSTAATAPTADCVITYAPNDGTSDTANDPHGAYVSGENFTALGANARTRAGYTLTGWNTAADGVGTAYDLGGSYPITGNLTLYAQWSKNTYEITYELSGGNGPETANPTSYTVETDDFMLRSPSKTDEGGNEIAFTGWSGTDIDGTTLTVTIAKGSTGNRTYTAHWAGEAAGSGDGTNGSGSNGGGEEPVDPSYSVSTLELTGEEAPANDTAQNPNAAYTVTYYASETSPHVDPNSPFAAGSTVTVRPGPTREGYTFAVWNTKADESGRYYAAGSTFTIEGDLSLYAIWEANAGTNSEGGNGTNNDGLSNDGADNLVTNNDGGNIVTPSNDGLNNDGVDNLVTNNDGGNIVTPNNDGLNNDGAGNLVTSNDGAVTPVILETTTGNQAETPVTYALIYYTADGQQISSYTCTSGQQVLAASYPAGKKAIWNTQLDGKGLTYTTDDPLTVYENTSLYYMGEVATSASDGSGSTPPKSETTDTTNTNTDPSSNLDPTTLW